MGGVKISIITVCYNAASTIIDTIESVISQDYSNIEYIIVDGMSDDGTIDIIKSYSEKKKIGESSYRVVEKWISEKDKGIYDAMNKGIKMASGEVVGILNADDFYFDNHVISKIAKAFEDNEIDAVFGDLIFVKPEDLSKTVRSYSSRQWHPQKFAWGYMPAHPTFFVRRQYYEMHGLFEMDYEIAADYEMLIRLLYVNKLKYKYLPIKMVKMRMGGVSSRGIRSNIVLNREIIKACRTHGIKTNAFKIYPKYFKKIFELIQI